MTVFGFFNIRKLGSPWRDLRLRQAVNLAINREDLIRYAAKGNGEIIPALVPRQGFGYDPDLPAYPFDLNRARQLLRDAAYPAGLVVTLIASEDLVIQATVVGKMLEQAGLTVDLQILDHVAFNQQTLLSALEHPPSSKDEISPWRRGWIRSIPAPAGLSLFRARWSLRLGQRAAGTPPAQCAGLAHRGSGATTGVDPSDGTTCAQQAYFLFLYDPIQLYAVNKAVGLRPSSKVLASRVKRAVKDRS
jgi:ABC-type transport system substrate-binding protein